MRNFLIVSAALLVVACGKKKEEAPPPAPAPNAPKVVEQAKPKEPAPAPAAADVTMTSKSPEAVKLAQHAGELMSNARAAEAIPDLKKALELDPDFAIAHAFLGNITPGPDGVDHLQKAVQLSDKLPEAEKAFIAGIAALRGGDNAKGIASLEKAVQLAPGAWKIELMLANLHNQSGDPAGAIKALEHALSVNPNLPQAQNGLAYAHAQQREWEPAIAAAKKQVELLPKEPNPEDTLGEIQLLAGKFDDSEKSFQAAVALDANFAIAWQGVGLARAYRGDFKGAYEAFDKRKASTAPGEKFEAMWDSAWVAAAEDKLPKALETLDAIEKDPDAKSLPIYSFVAVGRGHLLATSGKTAEAAKAYATAQTRVDALAGDGRNEMKRLLAIGQLWLASRAGKPAADADKLVAVLDDAAKASPSDHQAQSMAAWAHGLAAWAKSGAKDAVPELAKCGRLAVGCRADLVAAQRKAGDTAGADATTKEIMETTPRDPGALYFRAHLAKK